MKKNEIMLAAAVAGLSLMTSETVLAKQGETEKCWGVNKCKAHTDCGVSKSQIKVADKAFSDKFKNSPTHDCAGMGKCAASKGQLGWIKLAKGKCLGIDGGFLIERNAKKEWTVKQS